MLAVAGVVVLALVVAGLVVALTRKSGPLKPTIAGTGSATTARPTRDSPTSPSMSASASAPSSTGASTSAPTASTSPSSVTPSYNNLNLCLENDASTDLIHLTVTLSYAPSYEGAPEFDRDVLDSCVTPAALKELRPYYGKSFGLPGGDLTGSNGTGATARYSVQLVNTSKYVTFTLNRKAGTSGYQVVSLTAS